MEMPKWYREELRIAFAEKNVFTIIQLNKSWYKTLKQIQKQIQEESLDRSK